MGKDTRKRIGLIGFGQIGSSLHEMIDGPTGPEHGTGLCL